MTKYEFVQTLRNVLSNELNYSLVNDNVKYYEEYIDIEIRKGRSEEEVLGELGDPRLIAKTIIDTNKVVGENIIDEQQEESNGSSAKNHSYKLSGWLILIMVVVFVFLIFGVVTSLISFMLPLLFPILMIGLVIKLFTSNRR